MKSEDIRKVMLECLNESCVAGSNRHLNAIIHPRRHGVGFHYCCGLVL